MKRLIVANWKMNPSTYVEADELVRQVLRASRKLRRVQTVLCPPSVWLECLAADYAGKAVFGGQDVFWEERGAYTGEVSPRMLKNIGASWVIVGHSERRRHLGETDEMINKKVKAALATGLMVILCVGETLQERKAGRTKAVLQKQLKKDLAGVKRSEMRKSLAGQAKLVVAYEPVWAIGTGLPETPENANRAAAFIRAHAGKGIRVLYGGSVNAGNIGRYLAMPLMDGALVGGASLRPQEFGRILEIAESA